jgi:hypothetical protein
MIPDGLFLHNPDFIAVRPENGGLWSFDRSPFPPRADSFPSGSLHAKGYDIPLPEESAI